MTNRKPNTPRVAPLHSALLACMATCLALPVNAATSFPNYPLQTGVGSLPPNIMFILDDSGSMAWDFMPGAVAADANTLNAKTSPTAIGLKTYKHNTLYFDPSKDYQPWMKADGTRFTGGTTMDSVYTNDATLTGLDDIRYQVNEYYVPKAGVTDFTNSANFDRYSILMEGGVLKVIQGGVTNLRTDNNQDIDENTSRDYAISVPANTRRLSVRTTDGSGDVTMTLFRGTASVCTSANAGNSESCVVNDPTSGNYTIRLSAPRRDDVDNVDLVAEYLAGTFMDDTPAGVIITKYATWYSYYRTRSKAAKAGASTAFGELGTNFRVGFDSIWNRNGATAVAGDLPAYKIPVGNDDGLFRATNKANWFDYLQRANANSGTPLHGALKRAGDYFETQTGTDGPWGPEATANQLSCRQNFAILTTDGYWNDSDGGFGNAPGSAVIGNSDNTAGTEILPAKSTKSSFTYQPTNRFKDSAADTLADVAMYYWKRDLRTDLANNVPETAQNRAFWQHMSTFGISIGLQGTLQWSDVSAVEAGTKAWPNPWKTATNTNNSWSNESNRRIDDLMHAAVNGRGSFIAATDPDAFADALKTTLSAIEVRTASGSNVSTNGSTLQSDSKLFQAIYTSGNWTGDVRAFSLVGGLQTTPLWSVGSVAAANLGSFRTRGVYTWGGTAGATFPTTTQSDALARTGGIADVTGPNNAAYIKGAAGATNLRKRDSAIGDIVNSSPFFVKGTDTLFIGANDGMLHAINTTDGSVRFSYVPSGLNFAHLASLSDPDYQHRFFVDGGIDVTTIVQGKDKNILVGSLGRGGKGVYALDVTAPASFGATKVLWDKTFSSSTATVADADMGHVLGAPLVRLGNNGKTVAFVGNGIDSDNGSSVLYGYVMGSSGALESTIKIVASATGGGLAEPRAADIDNDGDADYIYAGDLTGNLWKFDVRSPTASNWAVANSGSPMFVATDPDGARQPITASVALARDPQTTQIFVAFGTGKYITSGDVTDATQQVQTIYSLIDSNDTIDGRDDLEERSIPYVGTDAKGNTARSWEKYSPLPAGVDGWFIDLGVPLPAAKGERVVTAPFVRGRALWFSSIIPSPGEDCDATGKGYINAIDMFTGTNPQSNGTTTGYIDVGADDSLQNPTQPDPNNPNTGDDSQIVGSVDLDIGMPGQGDIVGENVYACGSEAECGGIKMPPPEGQQKRLNWRELFKQD